MPSLPPSLFAELALARRLARRSRLRQRLVSARPGARARPAVGRRRLRREISRAPASPRRKVLGDRLPSWWGDPHHFTLEEQPADLIVMNRALHHVWEDRRRQNSSTKLRDKLRPGGAAAIWEPDGRRTSRPCAPPPVRASPSRTSRNMSRATTSCARKKSPRLCRPGPDPENLPLRREARKPSSSPASLSEIRGRPARRKTPHRASEEGPFSTVKTPETSPAFSKLRSMLTLSPATSGFFRLRSRM